MKISRTGGTAGTIVGAIGGAASGYVLWLVAFSIADDNAAVGRWAPTVLILSVGLAICAGLCGSVARRRGKYLWSGFGFGLPVLPVVLTLAVLADVYL
ncbi:hypothetical protein [Mycobacterium malmoense]|uniref:hypothetical protein n=1 Tax=Mycobacterium malmoense TaxID=1780 RepID=UPI0008F7FF3C|nr:hypothetical protein [Mycobacterium malmoense]OIN80285.1 hypothetical protein BMG05_13725 [Mycobacterium malmoense]